MNVGLKGKVRERLCLFNMLEHISKTTLATANLGCLSRLVNQFDLQPLLDLQETPAV